MDKSMGHSDRYQQVPFLKYNNSFCFHYQTKHTRGIWLLLHKWEHGLQKEGVLLCPPQCHLKANSPSLGFTPYFRLQFFILPQSWWDLGQNRGHWDGTAASPNTYHAPANEQWCLWPPEEQETDQGSSPWDCTKKQQVTHNWYTGLVLPYMQPPTLEFAHTSCNTYDLAMPIPGSAIIPAFYLLHPSCYIIHWSNYELITRPQERFPSSVKISTCICQGQGLPRRQGC